MHFSEIIKPQFEKKTSYISLFLAVHVIKIVLNYL